MQFTQAFDLPFPRAAVWAALQDLESVARCMPGASLDGPPVEGKLKGAIAIKLGPMGASFGGEGSVAMDPATQSGTITGAGTDRKSGSRAKGSASFTVSEPDPGSTRVTVEVDYQLAGALAQFNRGGIVQDLASRLTAAFAENLKGMIAARQPAPAEGAETPAPPPAPPPQASLDAGALIWAMIKGWFARLFGR